MTWLAAKLAIGGFLKRIPWQVWLALAVAIALLIGVRQHNRAIAKLERTSFAAGYAKAVAVGAETARLRAAADAKISNEIRSRTNEENRDIARRADDLRVRGPGQARCPNPAALPASPGRRVAASGSADAPAARVPDQEWIALPWPWALDQAEVADLNRTEVLSWREWHKRLTEERRPSTAKGTAIVSSPAK